MPAKPKSISQTSPRCGIGIFLAEGIKQSSRSRTALFVRQWTRIEAGRAAENLVRQSTLLLCRQMFKASSRA
jgi:hypothetical protein